MIQNANETQLIFSETLENFRTVHKVVSINTPTINCLINPFVHFDLFLLCSDDADWRELTVVSFF